MESAAQQIATKTQMNVIKTFLIISICFVLCWFPNRVYFFLFNMSIVTNLRSNARYITVTLAFLNVCLNPFIYAAKLDPVKKYLRQKMCSRRRQESDEAVASVINIIGNSTTVQMTGQACVKRVKSVERCMSGSRFFRIASHYYSSSLQ